MLWLTSGPELQLRAMSGFIAQLQSGSMLMSEIPVGIEGHVDARDLGQS